MVPAWRQVIAETLEDAAERLDNRSRFLRDAGLKEEANEARLCANVIREMMKETT